MFRTACLVAVFAMPFSVCLAQDSQSTHKTDVESYKYDLYITPIFHGSVMLQYEGVVIHVDPWSNGDYTGLPKADIVIITHHHGDHFDQEMIRKLSTEETVVIGTATCAEQMSGMQVLANGEKKNVKGIWIEAVPAYNIVRGPSPGAKYHEKGKCNGYVFNFGGALVYIAGDTENIPEMAQMKRIDVAFLPMNLPYTMIPEETAAAAKAINPRILYLYHYRGQDPAALKNLLKDTDIEVRVADVY